MFQRSSDSHIFERIGRIDSRQELQCNAFKSINASTKITSIMLLIEKELAETKN